MGKIFIRTILGKIVPFFRTIGAMTKILPISMQMNRVLQNLTFVFA